ncbi:MAG: NAD-dependent epimerase/dehydratase family protein [Woeseia sp.]|nr:NAD-dependent epimerase/dehydratase family protein [Woeseia sp.]
MDRRAFLAMSATGGIALAVGCMTPAPLPSRPKKILVLGGTNFVGPALVEAALAHGHEVTLFNRGITRAELFPELEKLRGVRAVDGGDLRALQGGRRWDAVIDVWPARSQLVEQTAGLLSERADYYFFVSSIAVYRDFSQPGLDENSPVHENDPGWYGGEKVLAEQTIARLFPDAFGVCRCHAILGPRDSGHAYHYWLRRLGTAGQVLAPGNGSDPVQYTDVRDVGRWIVDCVEMQRTGIYNVVGPAPPLTLQAFLEGTRDAIGSEAELVWADARFLRDEQNVRSFSDLPLWAPLDEDAGFYQVNGTKALAAGAVYRPLPDTARDASRWFQSHFFNDIAFPVGGLGLSSEREQAILAEWEKRQSARVPG